MDMLSDYFMSDTTREDLSAETTEIMV